MVSGESELQTWIFNGLSTDSSFWYATNTPSPQLLWNISINQDGGDKVFHPITCLDTLFRNQPPNKNGDLEHKHCNTPNIPTIFYPKRSGQSTDCFKQLYEKFQSI